MSSLHKLPQYVLTTSSWLTKAVGLALLLLVVTIAIGEGPPNPFKLSSRELILLISLLVSLAGTILVLWNQLIGGIAILGGMILFMGETHQWVFWAFALVGVLNIVCWTLGKLHRKHFDSIKKLHVAGE